eukprot:scaffold17422_cov67-Cyclotella_meneghiniana.AAC.2
MQQKLNGMKVGDRFAVGAHHFTEETVLRYWRNDNVRKCWAKRFNQEQACLFLHLPLYKRDRDKNNDYFTNAYHPMEEAASIAMTPPVNQRNQILLLRRMLNCKRERRPYGALGFWLRSYEKKNRQLQQQAKKRKMDRINSVVSDNKQLRDEMDQSFTLDDVTDILRRIGGLSRATLFDKAFYDKHPGAIISHPPGKRKPIVGYLGAPSESEGEQAERNNDVEIYITAELLVRVGYGLDEGKEL